MSIVRERGDRGARHALRDAAPCGARFARGLALVAVLALFAASLPAQARRHAHEARDTNAATIAVAELPPEARDLLTRIRAGGPFPYERDGVVFGNREGSLPAAARGYYHEYTVPTPGERTRGARRIVCGGARKAPEVCYYTADHYRTFRAIRD